MSSPYQVESSIPIPRKQDHRRRYPFDRMQIAQSFMVPCEPQDIDALWNTLTSCRRWATYKSGFRYTMRRVTGGIRVWRIQ